MNAGNTLKLDAARTLDIRVPVMSSRFQFTGKSQKAWIQLRNAYDEDYETFGLHKPAYWEVIGSV